MSRLTPVCAASLVLVAACGGGGGGGGSDAPGARPLADDISGTYVGKLQTTGRESTLEEVHLTLKANASSVSGAIYYVESAQSMTVTGTAGTSFIAVQGSASGTCPMSVTGSIAIAGGKPAKLDFSGTDCNGPISGSASITHSPCVNLSGRYLATETGHVTCVQAGHPDSADISGSAEAILSQDAACHVSYLPPSAAPSASRTGSIDGTVIRFTGPLVQANPFIRMNQNAVNMEGTILDESHFVLNASGIANGSIGSDAFSCTGTSTATFRRCYDLAVPILRGGPFTTPASLTDAQNVALHTIRDTLIADRRIAVRVFDANSIPFINQITKVQQWLAGLNAGCKKSPIPAMIIGHSLGADAATRITYPNVCSRTLLDFWDSTLMEQNQRSAAAKALTGLGTLMHYQAEVPDNTALHLLGRTISPILFSDTAPQKVIPGTNHQTIAVWYAGQTAIYQTEAARCMN